MRLRDGNRRSSIHAAWGSAAIIILFAAGCGGPKSDYSQLNLVQVTGTVTMNGRPLPNAVITFDAPDGQFSYGLTNASGAYALQIDSQMKGVTPGDKVVRISTARRILGLNSSEEGEAGPVAEKSAREEVPARYNTSSELNVTVSADQPRHDFDLSSTEPASQR